MSRQLMTAKPTFVFVFVYKYLNVAVSTDICSTLFEKILKFIWEKVNE
jgi:hypothetical protein